MSIYHKQKAAAGQIDQTTPHAFRSGDRLALPLKNQAQQTTRSLCCGAITLGAWLSLTSQPALADYEYWNVCETRVPLTRSHPLTNREVFFRLLGDTRFGLRYPGLGWQFFRMGPVWAIAPDWWLGTHFTTIAIQTSPASFTQEYRAELEPTWSRRLGDWSVQDRNRLEYRIRPGSAHFRYRNQLRVQLNPPHWPLYPYGWIEPLYEFNPEGLSQLRYQLGVARQLSPALRLDTGIMLRQRATPEGTWMNDWILNTTLLFAPGISPVLDGAGDD